jgi:inorganic pyrophosphatase
MGHAEPSGALEHNRSLATNRRDPFAAIPAIENDHAATVSVIVDTPKGSRNKYKWDEKLGLFKLGHVLSVGASFPYNFGFIPGTRGEDGDALDVLVLMDDPAFVGCLVPSRLIGVIEAKQTQQKRIFRNDRLIAVAAESHEHHDVRLLDEVGDNLLREIEHFFVSYNIMRGRRFEPTGRAGPARALALVRDGLEERRDRHG